MLIQSIFSYILFKHLETRTKFMFTIKCFIKTGHDMFTWMVNCVYVNGNNSQTTYKYYLVHQEIAY